MKTIRNYIFFICLIIVNCQLSIVNSSCTKADIHYRDQAQVYGHISIRPAGHDYQLPALAYHFYNIDTDIEYILRSCDGLGNFEGQLPAGTYRVIATNTAAANVEFNDMHSHELAMVSAKLLPSVEGRCPQGRGVAETNRGGGNPQSRAAAGSPLAQPAKVYSVPVSSIEVVPDQTAHYAPKPVSLTKELIMVFTLEGNMIQNVSGLSGELYGVYPSVHLYTCRPTELEVNKSPNTMTLYAGAPVAGGRWRANVNLFGICDPKHGEAYENNLSISLDMFDGTTMHTEVSLTDILSDVIEQNQGAIPIQLPLQINLSQTELGIKAEVKGWEDAGSGEGNLEIEGKNPRSSAPSASSAWPSSLTGAVENPRK